MDDIKGHTCKICKAGFVVRVHGQVACTKCAAGRFQHLPGKTTCNKCHSGRFNPPKPIQKLLKFDVLKSLWLTEPIDLSDQQQIVIEENASSSVKVEEDKVIARTVEAFGFVWNVLLSAGKLQPLPPLAGEVRRTISKIPGPLGMVEVMVVSIQEDLVGGATAAPDDATVCDICKAGKWTFFAKASHNCTTCPPGRMGSIEVSSDRETHPYYAVCHTCPPNYFSNSSGAHQCTQCAPKTWTLSQPGATKCLPCIQGQIFPNSSKKNCETCAGIDPMSFGDRGTYSFVKGGRRCHDCAPGRICHGGATMKTEWGWYLSSGLNVHKEMVRAHVKRQQGGSPLNELECSTYTADVLSVEVETVGTAGTMVTNGSHAVNPFECGDLCTVKTDPGCSCKYNTDGVEECRFFCNGGSMYDSGLYMDVCGLPRMVSRCPGFQRLVTCDDEFKNQMTNLHDPNHPRYKINIEPQCRACRENFVTEVKNLSAVVEWEKKRTISINPMIITTTGLSVNAPVDVLWLFDKYLDSSPYSLARGMPTNPHTMPWDLVQVTYTMPRSGIWDTQPYSHWQDHAEADDKGELEKITVHILRNDPRLPFLMKHIQEQENHDTVEAARKAEFGLLNIFNSTTHGPANDTSGNKDSNEINQPFLLNPLQCNIMSGYSGRLCRTCLPGFARSGNRCDRCPPYAVCVSVLLSGMASGFAATMIMVVAVVADAGSTSTASSLKRILLNHMQTVGMLIHFDLNWSPAVINFFTQIGAVSSIGDELIQSGCILGAHSNLPMRSFYIAQIGFFLLPVALMLPGTLFLCLQYGCPCRKRESRSSKARPTSGAFFVFVVVVVVVVVDKSWLKKYEWIKEGVDRGRHQTTQDQRLSLVSFDVVFVCFCQPFLTLVFFLFFLFFFLFLLFSQQ